MLHLGSGPLPGPAAALAGLQVVRVETAAYIVTSGCCSTLSEVALPSGVGLMAKSPCQLFVPLLNKDTNRWMEF